MPLIDCPVCGRGISSEAAACPQCGHPNRLVRPAPPEAPQCYSCEAAATTLCQACGKRSCVFHLRSIYVSRGKGGAHELRCKRCYRDAVDAEQFRAFTSWLVIGFLVLVFFFFAMMRG